MKKSNFTLKIFFLLIFIVTLTDANAVECYPPPDPEKCASTNALCIAAEKCNDEYRDAYEPDESKKDLFEYEVRNDGNKYVMEYCEWKKGLVLPNGRTYCP